MHPILLALLLTAAPPPDALAPPAPEGPILFSGVSVVPMDRERVLLDRDVLVERGVVRRVERHREGRSLAPGTLVVDGRGRYLIPGLTDMHVHTQFGDEQQLALYLVYGVTTVLNLSGSSQILDWRADVADGRALGPRIYSSGPILDGVPPAGGGHVMVKDAREARRLVDGQARDGYDFVKPYSALSREAFEAILDQARHDRLRVVGHVSWNVGVWDTIEARQDAIAHVEELYRYFVDRHQKPPPDTRPDPARIPTLARELARKRVAVITTLSSNQSILDQNLRFEALLAAPEMRYVPASYMAQARTADPYRSRGDDWLQQNRIMVPFLYQITAGLRAAGVQLLAGTDATNPIQVPGASLHDELALLVKAGLTPYEALRAATASPAAFLRARDAGTIARGKRADLVLLDASPLGDVANTRKIAGVMAAGRWLDRTRIEAMGNALAAHMAEE